MSSSDTMNVENFSDVEEFSGKLKVALDTSDPYYLTKLQTAVIKFYNKKSLPRKCFNYKFLKEGEVPVAISDEPFTGITLPHQRAEPIEVKSINSNSEEHLESYVFDRIIYKGVDISDIDMFNKHMVMKITTEVLGAHVNDENKDFLKLLDYADASKTKTFDTLADIFQYFSERGVYLIYEDCLAVDIIKKIKSVDMKHCELVPYSAVTDEIPDYFYVIPKDIGYMFEYMSYTPIEMASSYEQKVELALLSNTGLLLTKLGDVFKVKL